MRLFLAAALLALAFAEPRVVMQARTFVSPEWEMVGASPQDAVIPLTFAVTERLSVEEIEAELLAVSDPSSPRYGQHYTLEGLKELLAVPENTAAVHQFLQRFPVVDTRTSPNGDYVSVKVTVATAEAMLAAKFFAYTHKTQGVTLHRCADYSLPAALSTAVDFVGHTVSLTSLSRAPVITSTGLRGTAATGATPALLSRYYGITQNDVKNAGATQAVFETIGQSFEPSDVTAFDKEFDVPAQTIAKVIGPNDPSSCASNPNNCVEAELDVEVITSIAQDGATTFWSIPGDESFLQWIEAVASDSNPPLVHSISYGAPESEEDPTTATNFNKEVAKMGVRGLTVLVAAGDDGVAGSQARSSKAYCGFHPSWPATAPSVTAVGATQGPESNDPEIVCQSNKGGLITSGGGFSTLFDTPTWQSSQVSNYLSTGPSLPPKSMFASTGRGYPDITGMGHNYNIVVNGQTFQGSGTSASTPLLAGMITLINSARLTAGKSSVGFINPAIYGFDASVYNDITSGENQCAAGSSNPVCCDYGFTASAGWDPASGLGSPKFAAFKAAFMAL